MEDEKGFSNLGIAKTVVLPGLLVFLIPAIALAFFSFAQWSYDNDARSFVLEQIEADTTLAPADRASATAYWRSTPFSEMLRDPTFAAGVDPITVRHYAVFRWTIRLSGGSLAFGLLAFLLGGVSVVASRQSQQAQYLSLLVAWHALRLYAAAQVVIQGILLVALSYWVTALSLNVFSVKLVGITGIMAAVAAFLMLKAMWIKLDARFEVAGTVLPREAGAPFWSDLDAMCAKLGTAPPDQLIAGIDDNFFVTEHPVTVDGTEYTGRTLFVSLSLLKQLHGAEADAVLAHEMAHFSGNDTTFSKKISPLLDRYGHYLQALEEGGVTLPIFYFMVCFRTLFELSLRSLSRDRELRADRIATETTSAESMAGALLRIAAYSSYRRSVEGELFQAEQALETADISQRIEGGFAGYAVGFLAQDHLGDVATSHPFDTHPKMAQRLEAVGVQLSGARTEALLATPGDGDWFARIPGAAELERAQWDAYEKRFRDYHEEVLAWRYLPATDAETELVLAFFPELRFGEADPIVLTYERISRSSWDADVLCADVYSLQLNDADQLLISSEGSKRKKIGLGAFGPRRDELIAQIDRYTQRGRSARAYRAERAAASSAAP